MNYLKLIRIKNWIKNFLIFIPFIFSAKFLNFNIDEYIILLIGFLCFCLSSSIIYIINDILDLEEDRLDENKKNRPLASNKISLNKAKLIIYILGILTVICLLLIKNIFIFLIIMLYIGLNILYSLKLKHIPIVDITILSFFFLIRIFYGSILLNIPVSIYLYLTVLSISYYFGIGKRKKELEQNKNVRKVLEQYPKDFLDRLLNVFLGISIIYYSLWIVNYSKMINQMILDISVILVIIILIYYHFILHKETNGNPTDILTNHKGLICLVFIYCLLIFLGFFI